MRAKRFASPQEAAEAIVAERLDAGFCVEPIHEHGKWYITVKVVCRDLRTAQDIERHGFARDVNGRDLGLPLVGASYPTPFRLADQGPGRLVREMDCLNSPSHIVDHRARLVGEVLGRAVAVAG